MKSYRKMRDDALSGDPIAKEKFSFHGENSSFLVCRCYARAYRREGAGRNPQNIPELEANRQLDNMHMITIH